MHGHEGYRAERVDGGEGGRKKGQAVCCSCDDSMHHEARAKLRSEQSACRLICA